MADQKVDLKIICREMVKPSSPTPAHLSRLKLSYLDQLVGNMFVPAIWFYSSAGNGSIINFSQRCRDLKSSLSRALSLFYPFAGRIRDCWSVHCCDEGAKFVEAQLINCPMSYFCGGGGGDGSLHRELLRPLVPMEVDPIMQMSRVRDDDDDDDESLCVVQATLFDCGGVAICVCLSHKIADAVTFMSFVKSWSEIASDESGAVESPDLCLSSLLPPIPDLPQPPAVDGDRFISCGKLVTRRLFFSASKTAELKARASSVAVDRPTRVEAVMGLIWKCAVASAAAGPTVQHSAVCVATDLRRRLAPLVSKNTVGNLLGMVFARTKTSDMNMISNQVVALRKAVEVSSRRFEEMRGNGKDITTSLRLELEAAYGEVPMMDMDCFYRFSSLCGLQIYFDFGWGRAQLVTPIVFLKNMVMVMDMDHQDHVGGGGGGGVQALVTLEEQEMKLFEKDQQLLSFASLTPPHLQTNYAEPKSKL